MSDIRSFFSPSPSPSTSTKKRKNEAIEHDETIKLKRAKEEQLKDTEATPADAGATSDSTETETETQTETETEPVDASTATVEHSFANLAVNAKFLLHASWYEQLETEFTAPYFAKLVQFLAKEDSTRTLYPRPAHVFSALHDCAFASIKVVILGQDPYHGPKQAHGLCFSVQHGVAPPPSLKNVFKEAQNDVKIRAPTHGCLTSWSQQGVLLLNTVLTVRKSEPNSHKNRGWERFTDAVIDHVNRNAEHVVFLLWGKPAHVKGARIDTRKHLVVASSHPSPLGATKTNAPFLGSKCFSRTNKYLQDHGKTPIDWNLE